MIHKYQDSTNTMYRCLIADTITTEQLVSFQINLRPFMISDPRYKHTSTNIQRNRMEK